MLKYDVSLYFDSTMVSILLWLWGCYFPVSDMFRTVILDRMIYHVSQQNALNAWIPLLIKSERSHFLFWVNLEKFMIHSN